VVLARQHHDEKISLHPGDDNHGPVLTVPGLVRVRHPGPDDLARVGDAIRMWGVRDARGTAVVPRLS
jgi:hypothetical protein